MDFRRSSLSFEDLRFDDEWRSFFRLDEPRSSSDECRERFFEEDSLFVEDDLPKMSLLDFDDLSRSLSRFVDPLVDLLSSESRLFRSSCL